MPVMKVRKHMHIGFIFVHSGADKAAGCVNNVCAGTKMTVMMICM